MRIYAFLLIIALGLAGYFAGERQAIQAEAQRADAVLTLADDRLTGLIERYRYLPAVLGRSLEVRGLLSTDPTRLSVMLERIADTSGAAALGVSDLEGKVLAYSRAVDRPALLGRKLPDRPSLVRARHGALGFTHGVDPIRGQRQFFFDHPIFALDGSVRAVVSVELDMEAIEADWRGDRDAIYFTDDAGVIFISNRDELVLRADRRDIERPARYGEALRGPLPSPRREESYGVEVWRGLGLNGLPTEVLHRTRTNARIGMTAHILSDLSPVAGPALAWGLIGALLGGVAALAFALLNQRKAAVEAQLAERAAAANRLEAQVAERTGALRESNARLAAEVEERILAEAELRRVQDDLVQAGKMGALGEMSAGISHELNQPLTAIQTLADNSEIFMAQQKPEQVKENLSRISLLAARAGRILKTLRGFARKELEPATDVDLREVVTEALALSEARLTGAGVAVAWQAPDRPTLVRGGRVRLQQVVVNLLSNAADAMDGQTPPRQITIDITPGAAETALSVADTGPGLAEPDKIFDPFHTTKPPGQGLGLGLSISYEIVQQFGGHIQGQNQPDGGAVFRVLLVTAKAQMAA